MIVMLFEVLFGTNFKKTISSELSFLVFFYELGIYGKWGCLGLAILSSGNLAVV